MNNAYKEIDFFKCYYDNKEKQTITFLMDCNLWNVPADLTDLYVHGPFNSWQDNEMFLMKIDDQKKFYSVTVSYENVTALGNSGHPEYKFHSLKAGEADGYFFAKTKSFIPDPYCFHTADYNLILIFEGEDLEDIKKCSETAGQWRKLSDWSLNGVGEEADKEKFMFANSRLVPGTKCLYRSWHPFKVKTHSENNKEYLLKTEPERVKMSNSVYEKRGIKTDICLCGDETNKLDSFPVEDGCVYKEQVPEYYKALVKSGNVLNVLYTPKGEEKPLCPEYHFIYGSKFNEEYLVGWLKNIVDFVKEDHPGPYIIHCRLGNDRTGYYCGVIAALCGASWEEIANDYQSSNHTYLGEYRDQRLLKMVFEKQFKISNVSKVSNLKSILMDYYENNPYIKISRNDIELMVEKFTRCIF